MPPKPCEDVVIGQKIGSYDVLAKLGEGGMGEVYRAIDTNLKRTVAIKVLPQSVAGDADRLARFQREAEILAALNHPNIAAIYGLERSEGTTALVMELVEGDDLSTAPAAAGPSESASRGPAPRGGGAPRGMNIDDALPIARQIASALEAAHEAGIVHRDLKPANIKVRTDDTVKVLDFGLAKNFAEVTEASGGRGASSATMTSPAMTQMGMILGTAAYMSPEQAKGRRVDRRADVWAFGAVLYEMVTGTRAFPGDDVAEVLASVLAREPDWSRLPVDAPAITNVVRRCLERDPKQRFGDMQSVRLALDGAFSSVSSAITSTAQPVTPTSRVSSSLPWAITAVAGIAAGIFSVAYFNRPAAPASATATVTIKTMIPPPDGTAFDFDVTAAPPVISPNGRFVAFGARSVGGKNQIWVRPLDSLEARPVAGTEGASFPFWSPDSQSLGYYSAGRGRLERIDLFGASSGEQSGALSVGAPQVIAKASYVRGANWAADGTVLYDSSDEGGGIWEASISSGTPKRLITGDFPKAPWMLPDGKYFVYRSAGKIRVAARDGSSNEIVTDATSHAVYASGRLLFLRENTLLSQPFDLATRKVTGAAVSVASDVQRLLGDPVGLFSASTDGMLVYLDGAAASATTLAWFDQTGKRTATVGDMGSARGVRLSPDDRSTLLAIYDSGSALDLSRVDLSNGTRTRLTFSSELNPIGSFAVWSHDGRYIAYGTYQDGKRLIVRRPSTGGAEEVLFTIPADQKVSNVVRVGAWTNDGATLVYSGAGTGGMWMLPLTGDPATRKPAPLVLDLDAAQNARQSSNQQWVSYQAPPSAGSVQGIFVEAFPGGGKRQQAVARGTLAAWSADGKSLYYADDGMLTVVSVTPVDGALRFGPPRAIMPVIVGRGYSYDIAKDGRILALVTNESRAVRPLTLVQNWDK
jgi:serine/threonine protein kinase/sugar lactone lactonase YvrE